MEIALIICISVLILAIAALIYSTNKDKKTIPKEETQMELTNETKIQLQFEKAKAEIETLHQKANLFKNISDLIGLICTILIIGILIAGFMFIASLASCTGIVSKF